MKYKMNMTDTKHETNNSAPFMGFGNDYHFDITDICNSAEFLTRQVMRPAVEETMRDYLRRCTATGHDLSDSWKLCTGVGQYNCSAIQTFTNSCMLISTTPQHRDPTTTQSPQHCTMGMAMESVSTQLLLVGLVFIGMLLGIALTVAVCLICPRVHRWANSKIRGNVFEKKRESTMSSYYADIDDIRTQQSAPARLRLQRIDSNTPVLSTITSSVSPTSSNMSSDDFRDQVYIGNSYSGGEPVFTDIQENGELGQYAGLARNNIHNQSSHKYSAIRPNITANNPYTVTDPPNTSDNTNNDTAPQDGNNYFVLEKTT